MTPSDPCTKKGVLWLPAAMAKDMTAFSPSSASVAYNKCCDLSFLMATYSVCVMSVIRLTNVWRLPPTTAYMSIVLILVTNSCEGHVPSVL